MLGKLMKYEFKASGRVLLPLYGAVIVTAILSGLAAKGVDYSFADIGIFRLLAVVIMLVYCVLMVASCAVGFIIAIIRFKKNLFDSEGYLMHTLPVNAAAHIFSKLIVASVYEIVGVLVALLSMFLVALPGISFSNLDFADMVFQLEQLFAMYGDAIVLYGIEALILGFVGLLFANLIVYAAISIGHSTNSHKVRNSFGAYIVLYIAVQIINSVGLVSTPLRLLVENAARGGIYGASPFMIVLIFVNLAYAAVFFLITRYFMKNKLNLQ